jgi:hypothetical protein
MLALGAAACDRGAGSGTPPATGAATDAAPASAAASSASSSATAATAGPHAGSLVVGIVVDQFAAWVASERLPLLPADGGFARLRREGTYARDMRYAHAATDTAPGHAALYTGAPPRGSGVWANEVPDAATHGKLSILADRDAKLVFPDVTAWTSSSARVLKMDTVADRFRAAHPDALIVSLSLKDRGAIFGGGKKPTAALWYERPLDRFVTSTAFATSFPAWATPLDIPKEPRSMPWTPVDAAWLKAHATTPDDQSGEGAVDGKSITFPHALAMASDPAKALASAPASDQALLDLAIAALDAHRSATGTRLVALSLSANDYVGHAYGPDSWEAWDELRHLDAALARFFAALDARFGDKGWSLVLAADHGVMSLPETADVPGARPWCAGANGNGGGAGAGAGAAGRSDAGADRWRRPCGKAGRLFAGELSVELAAVAEASLHKPGLVAGVVDPYVYFGPASKALGPAERSQLITALAAALKKHPEVDRVVDTAKLPEACPPEADDSIDALVCRSFVPGGAGDLYIVVKPGSFFDPEWVAGKGTSHGSPYLFDRSVPLLVRAPGHAVAGRTIEEPISFRAFSRALATLLGVEPADGDAARALDVTKP